MTRRRGILLGSARNGSGERGVSVGAFLADGPAAVSGSSVSVKPVELLQFPTSCAVPAAGVSGVRRRVHGALLRRSLSVFALVHGVCAAEPLAV